MHLDQPASGTVGMQPADQLCSACQHTQITHDGLSPSTVSSMTILSLRFTLRGKRNGPRRRSPHVLTFRSRRVPFADRRGNPETLISGENVRGEVIGRSSGPHACRSGLLTLFEASGGPSPQEPATLRTNILVGGGVGSQHGSVTVTHIRRCPHRRGLSSFVASVGLGRPPRSRIRRPSRASPMLSTKSRQTIRSKTRHIRRGQEGIRSRRSTVRTGPITWSGTPGKARPPPRPGPFPIHRPSSHRPRYSPDRLFFLSWRSRA